MPNILLSLGSNLKTPKRQINQGLLKLSRTQKITVLSIANLHKTKAWGLKSQPDYCNTAVLGYTTLSPRDLLMTLQCLEKEQGRVRKRRYGARTLDIDILYYGNLTLKHPKLTLPHPRIQARDFVLVPLHELFNRNKNSMQKFGSFFKDKPPIK